MRFAQTAPTLARGRLHHIGNSRMEHKKWLLWNLFGALFTFCFGLTSAFDGTLLDRPTFPSPDSKLLPHTATSVSEVKSLPYAANSGSNTKFNFQQGSPELDAKVVTSTTDADLTVASVSDDVNLPTTEEKPHNGSRSRTARHHLMPCSDQKEMGVHSSDPSVTACGGTSGHSFSECLHEKCISPDSVLQFYNVTDDGIDSIDNYQPDIPYDILQLVRYFCFHQPHVSTPLPAEDGAATRHRKSTPAEAWGYGTGFVLVINCISMVGAVLVPIMDKPFYKKTLIMMVALGVGAMAGTSIFVLIPEAFDLMNIEETAGKYKWKSATVIASLFVFYVWEQVMRLQAEWRKQKLEKNSKQKKIAEEQEMLEVGNDKPSPEKPGLDEVVVESLQTGHGHSHGLSPDGQVATVAWIVLIADGIHKFVDGLSIGASFANSVVTGISVSVAILCEELPHELGDIAILVHSGMKMKKALLYNLLVSLPCLAGLAVGILLSEATAADKWIFSVAGGVFMYIALVDMLPEIRTADERDPAYSSIGSKVTLAALQDVGLLLGFLIILILVTVF